MRSSDAYRHYPNNSPEGDNNAVRCYIGSNSAAAATAFDANHSSDPPAPPAKARDPSEPSDQPRTTHAAAAGGLVWCPSSRSGADSDSSSNWK